MRVLGTCTAWAAIGFEGTEHDVERLLEIQSPPMATDAEAFVRIQGGRALYENVDFRDDTRGEKVRLGRVTTRGGLHAVYNYVAYDTILEVVLP